MQILRKNSGFSLVEMLVYVSILSAVLILFVNSLLAINRSYAVVRAEMTLDRGAIGSMERITREIRDATSIDLAQSVFGVNPSILVLNILDAVGNTSKTTFSLIGQTLHISKDGVDQGILLPPNITISKLTFYSLDSGSSKAIKIEIRLSDKEFGVTRTASYYSTVILRGSYK